MKHNVAPVTPPYNPPEREPKATPRKREKKQEPGKASTEKPPAVETTADEMLDEELRKNTAQTSTDRPADVDQEQLFIDAHQATGAELLQQSGMAESTETFDTSDPLTPFLAYVLFVLHYRNNPFADSWLIFKHSEMREIRDRKRAVLAHCRPWSTISHSEIDEVCLELQSFQAGGERLRSTRVQQQTVLLRSSVISWTGASRPSAPCLGPLFGCARISWYFGLWASYSHSCLDSWPKAKSGVDVLFRSMPHQYWVDRSFSEWAANLNWSTKNSSGIVFGGYMGGNFAESPSANTVLENSMCRLHQAVHSVSKDKRWAIRQSAARIDYIFIVADQDLADFPARSMLNTIADKISRLARGLSRTLKPGADGVLLKSTHRQF